MRVSFSSVALLWLLTSAPAFAQDLAVMPIDFGAGFGEDVEPVWDVLGAVEEVSVVDRETVAARAVARYGAPTGIDADWVAQQVQLSEDAYYAMSFDNAVSALADPRWEEALDAVVDLALNPELAGDVNRGLMTLARSYFYHGRMAEADGAILRNLLRFPEWVATTDWYQPEFVERFNEIREDVRLRTSVLGVEATSEDCAVSVNGMEIGVGRRVEASVQNAMFAVRVVCGRAPSRVHVLEVSDWVTVVVDPAFDWAYRQDSGVLGLDGESGEALGTQISMARAFGDIAGVTRVVAVGVTAEDALQLVDVDTSSGTVVAAVRAERRSDGDFPINEAVDALLFGTPSAGITIAGEGEWQAALDDGQERDGMGKAAWISFGVGGAGLVTGLVFAIIESKRWDDFDSCSDDPVCASSPNLDSYRSDAEAAGTVATIGFSVGIVAAVTGAVLLAIHLKGSRESADGDVADVAGATSWIPTVRGGVSADGGGVELGWRF